MNKRSILLTGGLGFIGSHIAVELLLQDNNIIIIDNLSNSTCDVLDIIEKETNIKPIFFNIDLVKDIELLDVLFKENNIDLVIHLAGLKSVNDSIIKPIYYYETNIVSSINLIKIMEKYKCKKMIFSSSSTVYGSSETPYNEETETGKGITNPYGRTKYFQEEILKDLYNSDNSWEIVILRYFNPISQRSKDMKEKPNGKPNNLFPYILQVYNGEREQLDIFGNDYKTIDGTCIRDFIHVVDVAKAHACVSKNLLNNNISFKIYNIGTGKGVSVQQLLNEFELINNVKINYKYVDKREGDLEKSFADVSLIKKELNWNTEFNLHDMVLL